MVLKRKGKISKLNSEDFNKIITYSLNYADALRKVELQPTGSNYKALKNRIQEDNVDISHFENTRWNNMRPPTPTNRIPLDLILVDNSTYSNTTRLKIRLLREGLLEYRCYECDCPGIWKGEKLNLQLDHLNGNNRDHRLSNLRLLCPNCHSQTNTFAGRNRQYNNETKYCQSNLCNNKLSSKNMTGYCNECFNRYKSGVGINSNSVRCASIECESEVMKTSKTGYCSSCYPKTRRIVNRPSKSVLLALIISTPFTTIGTRFGVSDNAIRKWCKQYNLPIRKKDIESFNLLSEKSL